MTTFFLLFFRMYEFDKKNQDNLFHIHMGNISVLFCSFWMYMITFFFFLFLFLRTYEFNKMNQDNLTLSTLIICFSQKNININKNKISHHI